MTVEEMVDLASAESGVWTPPDAQTLYIDGEGTVVLSFQGRDVTAGNLINCEKSTWNR